MKGILQNVKKRVSGTSATMRTNGNNGEGGDDLRSSLDLSSDHEESNGGEHSCENPILAQGEEGKASSTSNVEGTPQKNGLSSPSMSSPGNSSNNNNLGGLAVNATSSTPRADTFLPKQHTPQRRRSSFLRNQRLTAIKDLPNLRDTPSNKREAVFIEKLELCSVIFNFDDPQADKRGKEMKRTTLLELVEYVNTQMGQKIFTETAMPHIMNCVKINICRALPPQTEDFDPEEDEPILEICWPHLQVVYEFFLRFIVSNEVTVKVAKKYVDQKFCAHLIDLFDSEDPRERDYLKTILHRIYGKFMSHRSFIRKAISSVFYKFIYETERHNGIAELLEILGSIINGFAIPLKKEHLQFLQRALLPLHTPKIVTNYNSQLTYCVIQYVEKDWQIANTVIRGLIKFWPWSSAVKQQHFINELEEILEVMGKESIYDVREIVFSHIAKLIDSSHFQIVEKTLQLWQNDHLLVEGCLNREHAHIILPYIYGPLYRHSEKHWNNNIEKLANDVLKIYLEIDEGFFQECDENYKKKEEERVTRRREAESQWKIIAKMAQDRRLEKKNPAIHFNHVNRVDHVDDYFDT